MENQQHLKTAIGLYVFGLAVFVIQQAFGLPDGAAATQEGFELFADPADYTTRLVAAGGTLRTVLMLDLFFMIGYGAAIGLTVHAYANANRAMGWVAGLGIAAVVGLDLLENVIMLLSLDMAQSGAEIPAERIVSQVTVSSIKWFMAALSLVAFTFVLPSETLLEKFLIWSTRILMPLGTGLFVSGAFDARELGGLAILMGMSGGLALLALTTWLRVQRA